VARAYLLLAIAIVAEVLATSALKASDGFSRLVPSVVVVAGYGTAFYCLALSLKAGLSIGVAYAIWSGVGIVLIAAIGFLIYGERLDWAAIAGFGLIVAGVVVLNLFSRLVRHE
jgi:small multidrug resistance pump